MAITIMTSRKQPRPPAPQITVPGPITPPPADLGTASGSPAGGGVTAAPSPVPDAPADSPGLPPPVPSDDAAPMAADSALIAQLASVGIPAGLFTDGKVVPAHAALVIADHASAIDVPLDDVAQAIVGALKGLHIISDSEASQVLSALANGGPTRPGDTAPLDVPSDPTST